ncbi:MAG: dehydrogenase [Austwickia sp.]|nr:dehydrogenase [Austwickia sp.]
MPRSTVHTVVNVSLAGSELDYDERVTFLGRSFRIVRVGTKGRTQDAIRLVREWLPKAEAFAVTGLREAQAAGLIGEGDDGALDKIKEAAAGVPVTDGKHMADVLQEWAIRHVHNEMPGFFSNARTVVLGAHSYHARTVHVLREHTQNIEFADPHERLDIPSVLKANPALNKAVELGLLPYKLVPGKVKHQIEAPTYWASHALARRAARDCDILVATYPELTGFGLEDLAGKTLVSNAVSEDRLADLASRGVDMVVDATPQPFNVTIVAAMLEAMMLATHADGHQPSNDELLTMFEASGLEPRVLYPNGPKRKSRFVFVIHPLSRAFFAKAEPLGTITKVPGMDRVVEKAMAHVPPFVYSHVTGIKSPTGAEAEGWLISVGGTPKELLSHAPEFTYAQLLHAADMAKKLGAQVMGLGAFTKVVGDAGVTVARKAPLPVTTGNSYSASGALWAAHDAVIKLGLAEVDDHGRIKGRAMVVGATGAIGSVCARLLALACDELWMVSPETAKLLALKTDILSENPRADIHVAATPGAHLKDMDLIVTATSAAGQKVLDIMSVKPGCVITDVARPLDLSAEDVAKRPDVLVIESGEIELPGDVKMKDIGLPRGVAYACLAETIILALEGRYETFTVGRNIEWEKVKEIYALGLKHGMKLATISGVNGVFTDEDFTRVREGGPGQSGRGN